MPSPRASKQPTKPARPAATRAVRNAKQKHAASLRPPTQASKARVATHDELMTALPGTLERAPKGRKASRTDLTPKAKTTGITKAGGARYALDTSTYEGAEQVDPNKPLTEKQKQFVRFWAAGETIPAASARAGYSDGATFAYRLVRMPNVLKMYEEEKQLYREASKLDKAKITDMFLQAFDIAKLEADPHAMVSATRELGKIIGVYAPVEKKVTLTVEGEVKIKQMNLMSTEELSRLVYGGENAAAEALGTVIDKALEDDDEHEDE